MTNFTIVDNSRLFSAYFAYFGVKFCKNTECLLYTVKWHQYFGEVGYRYFSNCTLLLLILPTKNYKRVLATSAHSNMQKSSNLSKLFRENCRSIFFRTRCIFSISFTTFERIAPEKLLHTSKALSQFGSATCMLRVNSVSTL